jgi:Mn2+/Fe2+ NRAMP family transporter
MAQATSSPQRPRMSRRRRTRIFLRVLRRKPLAFFSVLGPGIISGASDNDPTSVASLAVIGSTTKYGLSWLVILVIPMLIVVQSISAAVGLVARTGLEDAVRRRYGRLWAMIALLCILAVNLVTLAADLEGGGAALGLLTGAPYQWFVPPIALIVGVILIWGSYAGLQRILRWALLLFATYIIAALLARPDWGDVLLHTIIPHFSFTSAYISGAIALLGTTLTSYSYVWETIEEGAERPPLRRLGLVQVDAGTGMVVSGLLFWFITIATGATLGAQHHPVQTAQDAARALAPVAGPFASIVFGLGLLASAVLAVPILAGTSAYVMAEAFGWRRSLDSSFARAPRFYLALSLCLVVGVGLTYLGLGPIQLLFLSSILAGLATPVTLILMVLIARDHSVMGAYRIGPRLSIAGFAVIGIVTLASVLFLFQTFIH